MKQVNLYPIWILGIQQYKGVIVINNYNLLDYSDIRLIGKSIYLRKCITSDCNNEYLGWLNDPLVNQYLETRWTKQTIDKITQFVNEIAQSEHSLLFAIIAKKSEKHIGNIKIGPIHPHYAYADVSYFIGNRDYWGKGLATEAVSLVMDFAFNELKLRRVQAGCFEKNIGSLNVLRKTGFSLEGTLRKQLLDTNGQWQDHLFFGKLNETLINKI